MSILWRELVKIFAQFRGSENIFGYQSTVANQLFLLYCFSGNIYFTKKIHRQVKYLWYGIVTCQITFVYAMAADYLWYNLNYDLVMIFNVVNAFGATHMGVIGFPLILYLFGGSIEAMILHVDDILSIRADPCGLKQNKIIADAKKYFRLFLISFFLGCMMYMFVCALDIILFFEQDKVVNYLYYAIPPPLIQKYGSHFEWLFFAESSSSVMFLVLMTEVWCVFSLVLYWCVICCNELASVSDYLYAKTCDLDKHIEGQFLTSWNENFEYTVECSMKRFQKATQLINYLRGFVEAIGTVLVVAAFCYGVALLYVCCSGDLLLVLKVKCSMGYMDTGIAVFLLYWIGQSLNDLASEVSLAVYFTPWYRSVKVRKDLYLLLCQTQSTKDFAVFKVYPLLLNNFSRYLHGLVSCTNILLKLTRK